MQSAVCTSIDFADHGGGEKRDAQLALGHGPWAMGHGSKGMMFWYAPSKRRAYSALPFESEFLLPSATTDKSGVNSTRAGMARGGGANLTKQIQSHGAKPMHTFYTVHKVSTTPGTCRYKRRA